MATKQTATTRLRIASVSIGVMMIVSWAVELADPAYYAPVSNCWTTPRRS